MAAAHRELLTTLMEWWEDVSGRSDSCVVYLRTPPDWGERRVIWLLVGQLLERQPSSDHYLRLGGQTAGEEVEVDNAMAVPSFLVFTVRSTADNSRSSELDALANQATFFSEQPAENSSVGMGRSRRWEGLDQLKAVATALSNHAGEAGTDHAAASDLSPRHANSLGLDPKDSTLAPVDRELAQAARSLGALSRVCPLLIVVENVAELSNNFAAFLAETLVQQRSRVLVVASGGSSEMPHPVFQLQTQVPVHTEVGPDVDASGVRSEAQSWFDAFGDPSKPELMSQHFPTLGSLARFVDSPGISRAKLGTPTENDIEPWVDRDLKTEDSHLSRSVVSSDGDEVVPGKRAGPLDEASLKEAQKQNKYAARTLIVTLAGVLVAIAGIVIGGGAGPNVDEANPMTTTSHLEDPGIVPLDPSSIRYSERGNGRFCFFFEYPSDWTRFDPDNGDGNRFSAPEDTGVTASYSGITAGDDYTPDFEDPKDMERFMTESDSFHQVTDVLDFRESNGDAVGLNDRVDSEIPGWRVTATVRDPDDGELVTEVWQLLLSRSRLLSFRGTSPVALFPKYEALLYRLAASLKEDAQCEGF